MSNFPTNFVNQTQSLKADIFPDEADKQHVAKLAENGYEIHAGLTKDLAEDISKMALEPAIKEFCPNDCGSRFKDLEATTAWLAKGRGTFLLMKKDGEQLKLAGYGWVGDSGSSHVPGGETTFAIRIGEIGQGQGLATPYSRLMVAAAAVLYDAKKMWLETWASNAGAVHVYHKIGFEDVDQQPDQRPSQNGQVEDTRLYMRLPDELLPSK